MRISDWSSDVCSSDLFTGFENIDVTAGDAATETAVGTAQSYNLTLANENVTAGGTMTIDGSGLRAGVVTGFGGDGVLGGTDDVKTDETLTVDGNLVTGGSLNVNGGAGGDAERTSTRLKSRHS